MKGGEKISCPQSGSVPKKTKDKEDLEVYTRVFVIWGENHT